MSQDTAPPLTVHHVPYGIEDPYSPEPWERFPREPKRGEVVRVAAISHPAGMADTVQVAVTKADGERFTAPAARTPFEGQGERWEASLGSFDSSTSVTYRFEARDALGSTVTTEPFSFETTDLHLFGIPASWEARDRQVRLLCPNVDGSASAVCIEIANQSTARLRVWPVAPSEIHPTPGALQCAAAISGTHLLIDGGRVTLSIALDNLGMSLRLEGDKESGLEIDPQGLAWLGTHVRCPHAVSVRFRLEDNEAIYGTGERFDQLDRRGLDFDARVYEQYKNQGSRTYLPVPMFLSSCGYAVAVSGTRQLRIDAGANESSMLNLVGEVRRDEQACLDMNCYLASSPLAALEMYMRDAGLPTRPPAWSFGLWMSANDWNSQQAVLDQVARADQERIDAEVVVIEAWSDETTFYVWNDAEYRAGFDGRQPKLSDFSFPPAGHWPDPKSMIETLHAKGIRLLLWQIPLVKQADSPHAQQEIDVQTAVEKRYCAYNSDGSPYRNPGWWFPKALVPDFTNTEAVEWWLSRRRYLVEELGVDGFKTDGGEHLWGRELRFADGRRGDELINAFPVIYAATYHQLLKDGGRDDGVTFSRAGYTGSQRYPAHWAGDEDSTWEAFRHSIVAGLSAGASGIPFWGWDIAGFSGQIPSGELYRRAWMMAAFCPIMQFHSEYNGQRLPSRDRTPWNIAEQTGDPHVLPVCRYYTRVRQTLRPYIEREAIHTSESGRPLMCALPLAFPDDLRCRDVPYEYLFGRQLLVAPTTDEGASVQEVYLPAGSWRDL